MDRWPKQVPFNNGHPHPKSRLIIDGKENAHMKKQQTKRGGSLYMQEITVLLIIGKCLVHMNIAVKHYLDLQLIFFSFFVLQKEKKNYRVADLIKLSVMLDPKITI